MRGTKMQLQVFNHRARDGCTGYVDRVGMGEEPYRQQREHSDCTKIAGFIESSDNPTIIDNDDDSVNDDDDNER